MASPRLFESRLGLRERRRAAVPYSGDFTLGTE
jgi:hypothetical protein